ncbi:hypothetical protein C8J57DRAFT_1519077 [Mycena rebaudengoi]|nr:hypothetical protein C8J57DRAFT_1519077 [Mycena rebaudengoi]
MADTSGCPTTAGGSAVFPTAAVFFAAALVFSPARPNHPTRRCRPPIIPGSFPSDNSRLRLTISCVPRPLLSFSAPRVHPLIPYLLRVGACPPPFIPLFLHFSLSPAPLIHSVLDTRRLPSAYPLSRTSPLAESHYEKLRGCHSARRVDVFSPAPSVYTPTRTSPPAESLNYHT